MLDLVRELAEDFERHGGSFRQMGFWSVALWRSGRAARALPGPLRKLASAGYGGMAFVLDALSGVELDPHVRAGEGLHLVHGWNIKIHPDTIIGKNVGIMHDVTIGTNMDRPGVPVIGDRVFIGAGAKILGPIKIGDDARIGANSLVINDVPAGAVAVGVPARASMYRGATVSRRDMERGERQVAESEKAERAEHAAPAEKADGATDAAPPTVRTVHSG